MEGKLRDTRILILTLSFGAGHVRAAEALAAEFSRKQPGAEIRVVDALEKCSFLFRLFYVWPYWLMIRFAPALWGRFFAARIKRNDKQTAPVWAWRLGCKQIFAEISEMRPDVIVCCEVGASEIAVIATRDKLTNADIINVITDFEAEPIWVNPEVDLYAVPHDDVRRQLAEWGARPEAVGVCGLPIDQTFSVKYDKPQTLKTFGLDGRPIILIMGGGMGPTRMDMVVAELLAAEEPLQIVALPGRDRKMLRKLAKFNDTDRVSLHVVKWTREIALLMQAADLLITKAGGVTLAEAAASGLPSVLFDSIPGPEGSNASHFTSMGAAVMTSDSVETARVSLDILRDAERRKAMSERALQIAMPDAAEAIVDLAIRRLPGPPNEIQVGKFVDDDAGPVLILTISNGYGHIRVAQGIEAAIRKQHPLRSVTVVDVADHMSRFARLTHVTAYLWIIKNLPAVWDVIDRYQKKQQHTSPEWFYRSGCRSLFDIARRLRPSAIVATEVGCCEIAALIKRDLALGIPLVAVSDDVEPDRAWVQPEVDLYCLVTQECGDALIGNGAPREKVKVWGAALSVGFDMPRSRAAERLAVCEWLKFDPEKPLILIAGGGEGMGMIEQTTEGLLKLADHHPQLVVLTGRNQDLKLRCERLANGGERDRLRVLGWTGPEEMPRLMSAADLMVSKLGSMFHEAIASELPMVAMEPPPGSERVQYRLLDEWGIGRPVRTLAEMTQTVSELLSNPDQLEELRESARRRKKPDAARRVVDWMDSSAVREFAKKEELPFNLRDITRTPDLRRGF